MSSVGDYLARACNAPLLRPEQEILLARQIQEGQAEGATKKHKQLAKRAKQRLIMSNLRLVVKVAKKFYPRAKSLSMEDLIQEGVFGLNRAAELFDPSRGYRFSTYSHRWIEHWIGRAIAEKDAVIRVPVHIEEGIRRLQYAASRGNGAPLDQQAIIEQGRAKADYLQAGLAVRSVGTLDRVSAETSGLWDIIPAPAREATYMEELGYDRLHLQRCLLMLSREEQEIIRLRYGIGCNSTNMREIGRRLGLTRDRVRLLSDRAARRLRRSLETTPAP